MLGQSGLKQNHYGLDDTRNIFASPSNANFNKRANSQMGNQAPRRRIMGGANAYATP